MANEAQSIVDRIQALGEGAAKYWFLTVGLPLEAQGVKKLLDGFQFPIMAGDHQVHDALTRTTGHGCATDMLNL